MHASQVSTYSAKILTWINKYKNQKNQKFKIQPHHEKTVPTTMMEAHFDSSIQ